MSKSLIRNRTWFRILILVFAFFFLAVFFVSPGVRYSQESSVRNARRFEIPTGDPLMDDQIKSNRPINLPSTDPKADELIKVEHQKAIDEIKLRLEQQDSWYHYKFIIIGGMFAVFLGQTGLSIGRSPVSNKSKRIKDILTAASNYSILALAVVIALVIDMHIRSNMFGMQTLGLWISEYVEPSYPVTAIFFPWERFLRHVNSPSIHLDSLYRLGFGLHLHFMTIVVYLAYMIVLQQICLTPKSRVGEGQMQIVLFGFLLVHLAALGFVFVAHAVPGPYKMNLIPTNTYQTGWWTVGYYLIPWVVLVAANVPYLLLLQSRKSSEPEKPTGTA